MEPGGNLDVVPEPLGAPPRQQPSPQDQDMSIIISLLITFLVIVLVLYLINMLPIDGRAKQIAQVIVIIIGIISLLRYLAVF
jgi:hypothetical protein